MKYLLIIITALFMTNCFNNPLDYGKTKLVHLKSDQGNKTFKCNDNIVADWSEWFEWAKVGNEYKIEGMGVRVIKQEPDLIIRFTIHPDKISDLYYQTEAVYHIDNYEDIKKIVVDSAYFGNLVVRVE
jgi:hypothetical protein